MYKQKIEIKVAITAIKLYFIFSYQLRLLHFHFFILVSEENRERFPGLIIADFRSFNSELRFSK